MNQDQVQRVKSIIEKVQVFQGFTVTEAQQLIKLCRPQTYEKDKVVYELGAPSTEMFILLQGKLVVSNHEGTRLGDIEPGATAGEMGALTGYPRSATVVAEEESRGFVIEANHLQMLMRIDTTMRLKILENIVAQLCDRVLGANSEIENYAQRLRDQSIPISK